MKNFKYAEICSIIQDVYGEGSKYPDTIAHILQYAISHITSVTRSVGVSLTFTSPKDEAEREKELYKVIEYLESEGFKVDTLPSTLYNDISDKYTIYVDWNTNNILKSEDITPAVLNELSHKQIESLLNFNIEKCNKELVQTANKGLYSYKYTVDYNLDTKEDNYKYDYDLLHAKLKKYYEDKGFEVSRVNRFLVLNWATHKDTSKEQITNYSTAPYRGIIVENVE